MTCEEFREATSHTPDESTPMALVLTVRKHAAECDACRNQLLLHAAIYEVEYGPCSFEEEVIYSVIRDRAEAAERNNR